MLAGCLVRGEGERLKDEKDNMEGFVARSREMVVAEREGAGAGDEGRLEGLKNEGVLRVYMPDEVTGESGLCGNKR